MVSFCFKLSLHFTTSIFFLPQGILIKFCLNFFIYTALKYKEMELLFCIPTIAKKPILIFESNTTSNHCINI